MRAVESPTQAKPETGDLEAARGGDEGAFERIVEPYRRELQAHCYRMLGSAHDAEDALQETLLRAWRGLAGFEGRSSLRAWLYRIATNVSLRAIERRPTRLLPVDYGPAGDPHSEPEEPLIGIGLGRALPGRRPRGRPLLVELLTDDAAITMPPRPSWYRGREAVAAFLAKIPMAEREHWRIVPVSANGQPGIRHVRARGRRALVRARDPDDHARPERPDRRDHRVPRSGRVPPLRPAVRAHAVAAAAIDSGRRPYLNSRRQRREGVER